MISLIDVLLHVQCLLTAKDFFRTVSTCKGARRLPHELSFRDRTFYELSRSVVEKKHGQEVVNYTTRHTSLLARVSSDLWILTADDASCIAYQLTRRIARENGHVDEICINIKSRDKEKMQYGLNKYVQRHVDGTCSYLPDTELLCQY